MKLAGSRSTLLVHVFLGLGIIYFLLIPLYSRLKDNYSYRNYNHSHHHSHPRPPHHSHDSPPSPNVSHQRPSSSGGLNENPDSSSSNSDDSGDLDRAHQVDLESALDKIDTHSDSVDLVLPSCWNTNICDFDYKWKPIPHALLVPAAKSAVDNSWSLLSQEITKNKIKILYLNERSEYLEKMDRYYYDEVSV